MQISNLYIYPEIIHIIGQYYWKYKFNRSLSNIKNNKIHRRLCIFRNFCHFCGGYDNNYLRYTTLRYTARERIECRCRPGY